MCLVRSWRLFLLILFWLFGRLLIGLVLTSSGMYGVLVLRLVCFELFSRAGWPCFLWPPGLVLPGTLCRFGGGQVAGLLAAVALANFTGVVGGGMSWSTPSLAPVLLSRRRIKSVADVLKGIRQNGFSQARCGALLGRWKAVCEHGLWVLALPGAVGTLDSR